MNYLNLKSEITTSDIKSFASLKISGKRFLDSSMLDEVSNSAVNTEASGNTSLRNDAFNCFVKTIIRRTDMTLKVLFKGI